MKTRTIKIKNLKIALSVLIFFGALAQAHFLFAATTTYVSNSSTGLTYEGEAADGVFTSTENQFAAGEYTIISTDGSDYVQHDILGFSKYQYHRFDFTIAEDPANITQIDVTWKGFGGKFDAGGGGGGASFMGNTKVETSLGALSLEKLYDQFKSNPESLPQITFVTQAGVQLGRIRQVLRFDYTGDLTVLKLSNGKEIRLTPYHEVLMDPENDAYRRAEEIEVGALLVSENGEAITLAAKETVPFTGFVYDLTVEEFHNFKLEAGIFVHNTQALDTYGHSLWVKESGVWTKKTSGTNTVKQTLTVQYTTNFANLITSGHMHVGAQSDQIGGVKFSNIFSALNSYYVEAVVTYNAVDPNVITSTADTNTLGTLRYALNNVTYGQNITFDATTFPSGTPATINVTSALPSLTAGGVTISAINRGVILNGSGAGAGVDGLTIASSTNSLFNLQIKSFTDDGIQVTSGTNNNIQNCSIYSNTDDGIEFASATTGGTSTILGCYIGTKSDYSDLGNGDDGIYVNIANTTTTLLTIGSEVGGGGNYIAFQNDAASTDSGIEVADGSPKIIGNFIGVNGADTTNLGNTLGINILVGSDAVQVGGTNAGEGNVIGFGGWGIVSYSPGVATIQGNYIGTDSAWRSLSLTDTGIVFQGEGANTTIGGTTSAARNYICKATTYGIQINNGAPVIQGNYIGTNTAGTSLANGDGIYLASAADAATIGGTAAGAGNVISRNSDDGIVNNSTDTSIVIQGNFIGTDSAGTASWPNGGDGIETTAGTVTIGNASEAQSNVIGPNTGYGINGGGALGVAVAFAGIVDINDDVSFTRTVSLGSANVKVAGHWTTSSNVVMSANSSTVTFDGSASQTITTNAKAFSNVVINNTGAGGSDLITLVGNFDINGSLTLTNGVLTLTDASNPNVTIALNLTINNSADPGITRGSGTWTFDGANSSAVTDNTAGLNLGDVFLNKTNSGFEFYDYNILYLGSSVKMISINIDGTAGSYDTLYLGDSGYTLTLTGNGTPLTINTNAVFDAASNSTLKFAPAATTGVNVAAATYRHVEFNKASNSFMLQGNIDVNGNLTITAGTLDVDSNGNTVGGTIYDITVGGNWANSGTFQPRINSTGTVTFDGSTTPVTLKSGGSFFNKVTINKSAASNEVDVITDNVEVGRAFNITTGTLDMSGTSLNFQVDSDMTIGTNGRFSKGTGTFVFATNQNNVYTDNSSNGPQNLGTVTI